ncbi:hypothetical protein M0P65_03810 [Candidatus Gracilibacteria bacterium]|nr:hypothetical protein [Candidatus Gracilibacteria bacterium]
MNINGLESNIEKLRVTLEEHEKLHNEVELYLKDSKERVDKILKITPSGTVICNGYEYSSVEELYYELNSDIKGYKNQIFFKEEGKKLLEQGYKFLNYDDDDGIMTTNQSAILRFSGGSFLKKNQLISILGGIIRKYIILSIINEDIKNYIPKKKDFISPSCSLYNENGELFFITHNLYSATKIYKLIED